MNASPSEKAALSLSSRSTSRSAAYSAFDQSGYPRARARDGRHEHGHGAQEHLVEQQGPPPGTYRPAQSGVYATAAVEWWSRLSRAVVSDPLVVVAVVKSLSHAINGTGGG